MTIKKNTPKTVDEYIATFPSTIKAKLNKLRKTIKTTAQDAEELISYGMPAYKLKGMLVYFAGYENHIGLYALPSANTAFKKELSAYKTGKASIQFPLDEPMPYDLITKIVTFRVRENEAKAKKK